MLAFRKFPAMQKDFVDSLPDDPYEALNIVTQTVLAPIREVLAGQDEGSFDSVERQSHDNILHYYALANALKKSTTLLMPEIRFGKNYVDNTNSIADWFLMINKHLIKRQKEKMILGVPNLISQYETQLGTRFHYQFSDHEFNRIQTLINELRDEITKFKGLSKEHRRRVLNYLENMQSELHKNTSDLRYYWGLLGEAGVIIGKFRNDIKLKKESQSIVDRMFEICKLAWKAQAAAEQIPTDSPLPELLPPDDE
jgi:hypothetical protein